MCKITFAQDTSTVIYQQYLKDKARFEYFEKEHRGYVEGANHRLAFLHWGNPEDKAFIWLPGSLLSAYDFEPFAESLVSMGYYVLSVDHYGHGLTEIPARDLDFYDFADDLSMLLKKLSIEKVVVGGFSRGGYLATAFYERYPDKVDGLILEEGGSVAFKSLFEEMDREYLDEFLQNVEPPHEIKEYLFEQYASEFEAYKNIYEINGGGGNSQSFGFFKKAGDRWVIYYGLNEYMNMQDSVHYAQVLNYPETVSRYASSMMRIEPLKAYKNLKVPMLIIDATKEADAFDSKWGNEKLKQMHPNLIDHQEFDCDNHNIHYGCPERFLESVKEFLGKLE